MSDIGRLVLEYVRAKWCRPGATRSAKEIAHELDPELRECVDLLGNDNELLLEVLPEEVLDRIDELEREAELEDAGVIGWANDIHHIEERQMRARTSAACGSVICIDRAQPFQGPSRRRTKSGMRFTRS